MMLHGNTTVSVTISPYFERLRWRYFSEHFLGDYRSDKINYHIPEDDE